MPRIDEIWAWVSSDGEGEGILAAPIGNGSSVTMPLVGADAARMKSLRPAAVAIADAFGVEVKLVRFSVREDIEQIQPKLKTTDPL